MNFIRKYKSLIALAACIAAALVFRRFTYVAWYPVVMSAAAASGFALSLFGRESLCYTLAKKIPPHILPEGAEAYCRKYTIFWTVWLCVNGLIATGTIYAPGKALHPGPAGLDVPCAWVIWNCCLSYCATGLIIVTELFYRRRRFAVVFHTSGSTAKPKTIVKTFDSLAKEAAYHYGRFVKRGILIEKIKNEELRIKNDKLVRKQDSGILNSEFLIPSFLCTIESQHMYGRLWRVLLPRIAGAPLVDETILTPESLLAHMKSVEKVFLVTTPSFLSRFCAYADQYDVPQNCVEIVTSGSLLTRETSAAAQRVFGIAPLEIFGSTETGGVAWRRQELIKNEELRIKNEESLRGFGGIPRNIPPTTNHQSPTTNHQSPTTNHQSPTTNHQSPTTNHQYDWHVFEPVKVSVSENGRLVVDSPFSFKKKFEMGDGAELSPDGRHFKLLGRKDRLVKIAEQRVSLPEAEEKMTALPEVKEVALAATDGVHGPSLGAVVVLDRNAVDVSQGKKNIALELRRKCLKMFPKGTVPKRYRFVMELPRNAQGKVQTARMKQILESNLVEPFVLDEVRTETSWAAEMVFDADAPYFKGHFPGFAVLPGVVQLGMAKHFAELFLRREITLKTVKKMKFTCVIVPGARVKLTLAKKSDNEISYEYRKGEKLCSSGVLCF